MLNLKKDYKKPTHPSHQGRFRQIFGHESSSSTKDPNAMDVDKNRVQNNRLMIKEQAKYHQEERCFRCHQQGHISKECPQRTNQGNNHSQNHPQVPQK